MGNTSNNKRQMVCERYGAINDSLIFEWVFFGDTAHYIIPISAAFVAGICYLMYKSELADKLLNNYEIQPRTKRKKKKKN